MTWNFWSEIMGTKLVLLGLESLSLYVFLMHIFMNFYGLLVGMDLNFFVSREFIFKFLI